MHALIKPLIDVEAGGETYFPTLGRPSRDYHGATHHVLRIKSDVFTIPMNSGNPTAFEQRLVDQVSHVH